MRIVALVTVAAAGVAGGMLATPGAAQRKLTQCHVGQRVGLPGSGQGTVVALRGTGGCDV